MVKSSSVSSMPVRPHGSASRQWWKKAVRSWRKASRCRSRASTSCLSRPRCAAICLREVSWNSVRGRRKHAALSSHAVAANIAPRPLLLLHPADDSITPTAQSIELFRNARMPAELHLFSEIDHFIFSDDNRAVLNLVTDWLRKFFPARQALRGPHDRALVDHGQRIRPAGLRAGAACLIGAARAGRLPGGGEPGVGRPARFAGTWGFAHPAIRRVARLGRHERAGATAPGAQPASA